MQSGCKEILILLALYREITLTNGSLQRQNISEEVSKVCYTVIFRELL